MNDQERARRERAAKRRSWPVRSYRLGDEPGDDLSNDTTPSERLAMMWELAVQAWLLTGEPLPSYSRGETPGRLVKPPPTSS